MQSKEFYADKVAKVYFESETNCLYLHYLSQVPNDDSFVKINTAVLDAFKSLNTPNFVADIRKMGIISLKSQQWVVEKLLPGMFAHLKGKKLYHAQLLDPKEILAKVSGNNIKQKSTSVSDKMEMEQFSSEEELRKVLLSKRSV
jgi:hypothetical protein